MNWLSRVRPLFDAIDARRDAEESLVLEVTELMTTKMFVRGWDYLTLATVLGVREAKIKQWLQGHDMTVRELAAVFHALNYSVRVELDGDQIKLDDDDDTTTRKE